jgi:hypothetical protein
MRPAEHTTARGTCVASNRPQTRPPEWSLSPEHGVEPDAVRSVPLRGCGRSPPAVLVSMRLDEFINRPHSARALVLGLRHRISAKSRMLACVHQILGTSCSCQGAGPTTRARRRCGTEVPRAPRSNECRPFADDLRTRSWSSVYCASAEGLEFINDQRHPNRLRGPARLTILAIRQPA